MYNTFGLTNGLSLAKVIGGISKTLQIANQVIPLYQKAKPMISNARNIMGVLKTVGTSSKNNLGVKNGQIQEANIEIVDSPQIKKAETTSPTFFL